MSSGAVYMDFAKGVAAAAVGAVYTEYAKRGCASYCGGNTLENGGAIG
jgi:hypothetical protein